MSNFDWSHNNMTQIEIRKDRGVKKMETFNEYNLRDAIRIAEDLGKFDIGTYHDLLASENNDNVVAMANEIKRLHGIIDSVVKHTADFLRNPNLFGNDEEM